MFLQMKLDAAAIAKVTLGTVAFAGTAAASHNWKNWAAPLLYPQSLYKRPGVALITPEAA